MTFFAATGLINAIVSSVCGTTVLVLNHKSKKNQIYSFYCLSLTIWSLFYFLWLNSKSAQNALLFSKCLMAGAIFIPTFHYHHILSMFELNTRNRIYILYSSYILSLFLFLTNFSKLIVTGCHSVSDFPFWPIPGPLFPIYLFQFAALLIISIKLILEYRNRATAIIKNQIYWVAIATAIGYGGGSTNFLLWYGIPIKPYLNILVPVVIATTALMFFRLQLLDIQFFLRNTTVHSLTSLFIGGVYSILAYYLLDSVLAVVLIMTLSFIFPVIYKPIYTWVKANINRTRLGRIDEYLGSIESSMDKVRETTYTYDDLAKNIVNGVMTTFPIEMAAVYLLDTTKNEFHLRAQSGMKNPLSKDIKFNRSSFAIAENSLLITLMTGRKNVVLKDEVMVNPLYETIRHDIVKTMTTMESELCVPFLFSKRVHGFLAMGKKEKNQMYHQDDLKGIYSFGRIGEEILRYIMGMEHEVHHAALYSHDMNNDTKSLTQTLQFLRSPLGKMAKPEKIEKLLLQAEDVAVRLNQSFSLNRDRSALILKSIKGEYERHEVDLIPLIRESCNKYFLKAEEDGVTLDIDLPAFPIVFYANELDFIRIVDNLLSNAFRYVAKNGIIRVEGKEKQNVFHLSVFNNGASIDPKIIERVWDFGWQVKDSKEGASGLGLSIVKQIITLHGGTIGVESSNEKSGTTFHMIFPLNTEQLESPKKEN